MDPIYLGPKEQLYLAALLTHDWRGLRPWLTKVCTECDRQPPIDDPDHVILRGHVVIGCEGYPLVNPNALGIHDPEWHDWTEDSATTPDGIADDGDLRRGRYLYLLQRRFAVEDITPLKPWLSTTCHQCGEPASALPHIGVGEYVAIGCGGYFQINPNVLGMDMRDWDDWTVVKPDVTIGPWRIAPGGSTYRAQATITVELDADVMVPRSNDKVAEELLRHFNLQNFETEYGGGDFDVIGICADPEGTNNR